MYGYLGPNGAGKTTSLRMLLGLIRPTAGTAQLFGRDPVVLGRRALQGVAGFVEAPQFYPYLTGRKNLELCAAYDGGDARTLVDEMLETVDLADRGGDRVGNYSHGMKQRLGIAAALLRRPQAAAPRRAEHRPRPGRHARHEDPGAPALGGGHHRDALEPPDDRRRGAVQPGRDHQPRPHPVRGRRRRAQAVARHLVPAARLRPRAGARGWPRASTWATSRSRATSCASAATRPSSSSS